MCEKKPYSQKMKALRKSISFRLDLYSLPDFKEKYLSEMGEISNNYRDSILSESERQMVDIDTIAYNLGETIETIAEKKVYYFTNVVFDKDKNVTGLVIISPYYIYVQVNCIDGTITEPSIEKIKSFLFNKVLEPVTTSKFFTCQVYHYKQAKKEELDSIIDKDAFKSIDVPINGRYADEYTVNGKDREQIDTTLIRYLQLYKDDLYDVLVQTMLSIPLHDDIGNYDQNIIDRMISISEQETSRCFI